MARNGILLGVALGVVAVIGGAVRGAGADSVLVAFLVVWSPMAWFALVWRWYDLRLPASVHQLRPFERDGRIYVLLGVRLAKALLRRGPLTVFNLPRMRLPDRGTEEGYAAFEARMQAAEAVHGVMFAVTVPVAVGAALAGELRWAAWVALFNLVVNGYPAMLQRYNRARLAERRIRSPGPHG
jgi:Glycosyl-4,4'-diaponeurosporenoate acyltransferase